MVPHTLFFSIVNKFEISISIAKHPFQTTVMMATHLVHCLKQAGDITVRWTNGNLRFPGFRTLDGCETTVDMDVDPEVFMMLEPVQIVGNKVTPNNDMKGSARRLRSIFAASNSLFQWRFSEGEKMLREKGIQNIPDHLFEEIKTSLVRHDGHFAKFSPTAFKRCLLLFTDSVLEEAPTLLPTGKGNTDTRDFVREA